MISEVQIAQAVVRHVGGGQAEAAARLPRLPAVRRLPPPAPPGARPAAHAHPRLRPQVSQSLVAQVTATYEIMNLNGTFIWTGL